jgi:DNA-binding transcriptional LysR family regulator
MIYAPELDYIPQVGEGIRPTIKSSSLLAQQNAILAGQGLGILPRFMANGDARLTRVLPRTVSLIRTYWLTVHEDIAELARIRVTADFIAAEVRANRRLFLP